MSAPTETLNKEDRVWLEKSILNYMSSEMRIRVGVSMEDVVGRFAPIYLSMKDTLAAERPSFGNRERKVQRNMTVAAFRRLIAIGRLGLVKTYEVREKGKRDARTVTLYKPISILDAMAGV